jgi:hypothetical protein
MPPPSTEELGRVAAYVIVACIVVIAIAGTIALVRWML